MSYAESIMKRRNEAEIEPQRTVVNRVAVLLRIASQLTTVHKTKIARKIIKIVKINLPKAVTYRMTNIAIERTTAYISTVAI